MPISNPRFSLTQNPSPAQGLRVKEKRMEAENRAVLITGAGPTGLQWPTSWPECKFPFC